MYTIVLASSLLKSYDQGQCRIMILFNLYTTLFKPSNEVEIMYSVFISKDKRLNLCTLCSS